MRKHWHGFKMVFIGIVYSSCMYSSSLSTASKGSPARPLVGLGAASAAAPRSLHRLAILHTPNSLHQSTNLQFEVLNNYYWDCCLSVFFSRVLYLYILKAAAPLYYNFLGVSTSLKKKSVCYVKMFLWNNSPITTSILAFFGQILKKTTRDLARGR